MTSLPLVPPLVPSLPQNDPNPDQRAAWLACDRSLYQFDTSYEDIGFVKQVPLWDQFSPEYLAKFAALQSTVYANQAASALKQCQSAPEGGWRWAFKQALETLEARQLQALWGPARDPRVIPVDQRTPLTIADYEQIFQLITPPPNIHRWRQDWDFAWQRIAGTAPILIRAVSPADPLPDHFAVSDADFQRATGGSDSLAAALAEQRLFLVDFAILDGIAAGISDGYRKTLCAPLLLLVWQRATATAAARLMPVAIQCQQTPGPDNPVFTPADGMAWQMAKLVVQSADSNYHGVVEHLGRCHIMLAWITLYSFRHLAPCHPVRVLLTPNFQFTLAVNVPTRSLIYPGGRTPRLQAVSTASALELIKRGFSQFDWNQMAPPTDFERRGVLSAEVLPLYPYRDDALPQWAAISAFAEQYIRLYYSSDLDVTADFELQDWFRAMGSGEGAQIHGMGRNGQLETVADLSLLVAQIIFRATVFHALINYTVFPAMGFMPNMPTALYAPPPQAGQPYGEADLLQMLPPRDLALEQLSDVYVVGHLRINALGQYADCYFQDRRVRPLVLALQSQLAQIEHDIHQANRQRPAAFEILLPSNVTQSIHI
jgi:arachidonate 15-lipoxygenase